MLAKIKSAIFSGTARDTFFIFAGNSASAGFGLFFTLLVAKVLSVAEFGIFSAVNNLIMIACSLSDAGTSSGSLKFIAHAEAKGDKKVSRRYTKAAFLLRFAISTLFSLLLFVFAPLVAKNFLATSDIRMSWWAGVINFFIFVWLFTPFILRARGLFLQSAIVDGSLGISRFLIIIPFYILGAVTLESTLWVYLLGTLFALFLSFYFMKLDFFTATSGRGVYNKLLRFSGWLGVNNIISAISGRLDVTMLAALTTATATGIYSLASRFALFIVVLTGSFSAVLATRFASFGDKQKERAYLVKSTLGIAPIALLVIVWVAFAEPFLTFLFGMKYLPAVPVFQALAIAYIPFIFTAPAVSAIIYAMKKPVYIGYFSFFQIAQVFLVNLYSIPKLGAYGPILSLLILNVILVSFVWIVVARHYWRK